MDVIITARNRSRAPWMAASHVPEATGFATKPGLAVGMIQTRGCGQRALRLANAREQE